MTSAKVIADSHSTQGYRLTTMEVTFHRFVLAEFNTHRMFARNSASSRAIPVEKQIQRLRADPAYPVVWPREQKGMQGGESVERAEPCFDVWSEARDYAVAAAISLMDLGVHKSVTNRLLEPFMWHTVIVTGTSYAYENFFKQRCSPLAQPEIRVAAEMMKEQYDASTLSEVKEGQWHLPFIDLEDWYTAYGKMPPGPQIHSEATEWLKKVSVARCARVSYLTHDGIRDQVEDVRLYNDLVSADPPHWSPLEHVATPWNQNKSGGRSMQPTAYVDGYENGNWYTPVHADFGPFMGWRSLRTEHEMIK